MPNSEMLEFEGIITELLPNATFHVEIEVGGNKQLILCHLSGKLRMHFIRCAVGDRVTVVVSPYDLTKGRIVWRSK